LSWLKAGRKPGRKPGFRPGFRPARVMECGLYSCVCAASFYFCSRKVASVMSCAVVDKLLFAVFTRGES